VQSRRMSAIESVVNVVVGIGVAFVANIVVLSAMGFKISYRQNVSLALIMTAISLVRSYSLRRLFNRWR
jgi:uncharacterized membrane protein YgaE (UPF0421/DUF939 family)